MSSAVQSPITRRRALAATFALSTATGAGGVLALDAALSSAKADDAAPHPDAALIAYAPRLAALQAEVDRLSDAVERIDKTCAAETAPRPDWDHPDYEAWRVRNRAVLAAHGQPEAQCAFDSAVLDLNEALDEIAEIPALTLDGLCLKARYGHDSYDALVESIAADLYAIDRARTAQA